MATNNNVLNVQFLRNQVPYANRDLATAGLQTGQANALDGSVLLARYYTTENNAQVVKTLVAFVYASGATKSSTIFDLEGSEAEVKALREEINAKLGTGISSANTATAQLTALSGATFTAGTSNSADTSVEGAKAYAYDLVGTLDYTDTAETGSYVSAVNEVDGIISVTRVALPDASSVADDNKVVTDVTQSKGAITATASNITGIKLAGYQEGTDADIAATDTLGQALGKLQAQINAMDLTVVSGDGEVIVSVSEEDGKVAATKSAIKDVKLTGYEKDTTKTGAIAATDDIEDALSKLENKAAAITINDADGSINVTPATSGTDISVNIKTGDHVLAKDGGNGVYTDIKLSAVTPSSTTVKEEYSLIATDGSVLGTNIKIYKDSHIVSITYITNSGDTHYQNLEYVYIDASGNTQTEYVDISSLVLEAEFASGVTITNHVAHGVVDPTSEKDSNNDSFLTVGADGFKVDGIKDEINAKIGALDATVGDTTVASGKHVAVQVVEDAGVITAVTVTEDKIADADDLAELSAKTVTALTSTNSSITAQIDDAAGCKTYNIETDASKIKMSGFTSTDVLSGITSSSSITEAFKEVDNVITSNEQVTSSALNDLNSRINTVSGDVNTISGKVETLTASSISAITVNGSGVTVTSGTAPLVINSTSAATSSNDGKAIIVTTNNDGSVTLSLGAIDCGFYE